MNNDTLTRKTHRLHRDPLNWTPLAAASKRRGEPAASGAFVSLPAWPTPLDCNAACQQLPVSDDTDPPREIS
jgi:hypothetical protein